ncbi:hypothetical protein GIY30_11280 [Gordonia sp. HNM0687]|uniref:Transmembrane protein n=1 Tax=Gordonia mangrovi TaxID=2665643 RepID=A0A6L7GQM0_9ACTN|nr:hypothetical protein [Gordonia mangrovi]MXP21932.1 hypothetical protein [Gordonia mangrovi]UVF76295.1 hypothetical protein NWF22_12890 [Gordonia mangrovi]
MTRQRHPVVLLVAVSGALTALIMAPLLRPGHLLYRDAVSTPRSFVTDTALGLGDLAPRAVPQDWVVATASGLLDGGVVVVGLTVAALVFAGVGYGRLALRLVGVAGRTGAVAAAVVAIWNPYVAERLLQGHWSLLVSYAALGWVAVAAVDILRTHAGDPRAPGIRWAPWAQLVAGLCAAGFTPTGSMLSGVLLIALGAGVLVRSRTGAASAGAESTTGRRLWSIAACAVAWVVAALPWLTATLVGGASTTGGDNGFAVFGVRAEPGLGTLGTALGLTGIWNSDAVPASRTIWWAAVATAALLIVVAAGTVWLWRHRGRDTPVIATLGVLAAVCAVAVSVAAIGPVAEALSDAAVHVPGLGLFRDTQKYLALMVPFVAVATAAAIAAARRWVPAGFAFAAAALLIVAPLPDLAWGVGGKISPVTYPQDWAAVANRITSDHGAVAVWPTGSVRRYTFADGPSLDPLPRMVRAPVVESGRLVVDSVVVDAASGRGADVDAALSAGGSTQRLAELGVGWVVVENHHTPPALVADAAVEFRGDDLTLYRVPGPITDLGASTAARSSVVAAHVIWATTALAATVAACYAAARRRRR